MIKCIVRHRLTLTIVALATMLSFLNIFAGCIFCSSKMESEPNNYNTSSYRPLEIVIVKGSTTYEAADGGNLDRKPEIIHYVKPEYPWLARAAGIEGTALLEVIIKADGRVEDAKIVKSNITPKMQKSLLQAAMFYIYEPGIRKNDPIICKATHLIRFTLNDDVVPIRLD